MAKGTKVSFAQKQAQWEILAEMEKDLLRRLDSYLEEIESERGYIDRNVEEYNSTSEEPMTEEQIKRNFDWRFERIDSYERKISAIEDIIEKLHETF